MIGKVRFHIRYFSDEKTRCSYVVSNIFATPISTLLLRIIRPVYFSNVRMFRMLGKYGEETTDFGKR